MSIFRIKHRKALLRISSKVDDLIYDFLQLRQKYSDPLDRIVAFYSLFSSWYERILILESELEKFKSSPLKEKIGDLFRFFKDVVEDKFGESRAKKGDSVTANDVFLGGVYGLDIRPVSYWKSNKETLSKDFNLPESGVGQSVYVAIRTQAENCLGLNYHKYDYLIRELNKF